MIEAGIYTDLSSEDYHGHKESISRSALMDFKKSPRNYWAKHLNPDRPVEEDKASWILGTAFHTLILEPELFSNQYFIMPKKVLKRENEELFENHKQAEKIAETTTRTVLTFKEWEQLLAMQVSLFSNARAKELIEGAVYESSYFWRDEESGLMVKCRPDILHPNIYVDLKTIDDASPHNYQREMMKHGYHIQGAMTMDGVFKARGKPLDAVINICVEKKYPCPIGIYMIDQSALEAGHHDYKSLLLDLSTCIKKNEFPDYEIQTIGLPKWAL